MLQLVSGCGVHTAQLPWAYQGALGQGCCSYAGGVEGEQGSTGFFFMSVLAESAQQAQDTRTTRCELIQHQALYTGEGGCPGPA